MRVRGRDQGERKRRKEKQGEKKRRKRKREKEKKRKRRERESDGRPRAVVGRHTAQHAGRREEREGTAIDFGVGRQNAREDIGRLGARTEKKLLKRFELNDEKKIKNYFYRVICFGEF